MENIMTNKKLWIHAGGSKTGSSALQNFFELNVDILNKFNFAYNNRTGIDFAHQITSGNGLLLYDALQSINKKNDLENIILSYFDDRYSYALCSSEYLQGLDDKSWKVIIEICEKHNIEIRVIFYIRDVTAYFSSGYDQVIKRHGEWRSIDEWSSEAYWDHLETLKTLSYCFSKENLLVYSYENSKQNIIEHFLKVIEIDEGLKDIQYTDMHRIVNRSLTHFERELLKKINQVFGERYSSEISDILIYTHPDLKAEPEENSLLLEKLSNRYCNDIIWINHTFFNNEPVVSIGNIRSVHQHEISEIINHSIQNLIFDWLLSKLSVIDNDTKTYIIDQLDKAFKQDNRQFEDIPKDFDSVSYLLLNQDVLLSGMDAEWHYMNYGKFEGREYITHQQISKQINELNAAKYYKLLEQCLKENSLLRSKLRITEKHLSAIYTRDIRKVINSKEYDFKTIHIEEI
jgi:hypothetical protein